MEDEFISGTGYEQTIIRWCIDFTYLVHVQVYKECPRNILFN